MTVKWHGYLSNPRRINGGGPQGATIGILEYLSQSNNNTDFIDIQDKFKFVDDLTVLETVNRISVGLTSYNTKNHITSDISTDNHFIPSTKVLGTVISNDLKWELNTKNIVRKANS